MKARVTSVVVICLLFISLSAVAQPDILSAVPGDAYGFVATNSLQGSYDKVMTFAQAMGLPVQGPNKLLAIQEHVGDVDLDGPAAIVLLDPQKFPDQPIVLLFSAADAKAVIEGYGTQAEDSDLELPAGVVKGDGGYLAVKNGFVVFSPQAEQAAAVLASQAPLAIMPAVNTAFDKGQIVLAGDMRRAEPWITDKLNFVKAQMAAQMAAAPMPQTAMAEEMTALYLDLAEELLQQTDKLALALDVTTDNAILTKWVLLESGSPAAAFMNAQMNQPVPTYSALPGGPFLMAGGFNIAPGQLQGLTTDILNKLMNLPSIRDNMSPAQIDKAIADANAANTQLSGCSFTLNIGNPMTGMLNIVAQGQVSDSENYRKTYQKMYEGDSAQIWAQMSGMPVEYVYTSAAETCSDVQVDTIKMQMTEGAPADPMMAQQMQMAAMMYGPDMTFRMAAPTDKEVLFTMGGGAELMERAINVAQGRGSVLANEAAMKQGTTYLPTNRFAEAHLDISQVMPMLMMVAMGQPGAMPAGAAVTPPVSFSCSAETNTLRADMVLPAATVRGFMDVVGPMMMQGMGSGGGPPDEEF